MLISEFVTSSDIAVLMRVIKGFGAAVLQELQCPVTCFNMPQCEEECTEQLNIPPTINKISHSVMKGAARCNFLSCR